MAQLLARLHSGRNLELDRLTIDAWKADRPAERGGGEAHRAIGDQGGALAGVDRVPLHVHEQVEVAARGATYSGLAFARDADARALIDAGGDLHRELALAVRPAFAVAVRARVGDHFARAAAGRAAALDNEEPLLRPYFAHASARLAGLGAMLALGAAAAVAALADGHCVDGDGLL